VTRPDTEAEVLRLFYAEHWKVGTISEQLGLHPDVVKRVLGLGRAREPGPPRARLVDPYRELIAETLRQYPRLRSTRLLDMLRQRGFRGAERTLRKYVHEVRPRPSREVYLSLHTLPGEQAQVDWAYVGKLPVDGAERSLWLFVFVLSYSRALWGEFVFDLSVHSLCRSLVRASRALGGVPRQWLFDNPKTVVIERVGDAVRFHPVLLELCGQMRVQPRLCAVRRPEHKGRVERSIRYLRERFLAGRTVTGIADGNRALDRFIAEIAHARPHPELAPRTVGDVLIEEQSRLLPLAAPLPETDLVWPASVDKQAFVRFDTNRYSVPSQFAHRTVTLVANDQLVRLVDGQSEIARHARCWGRRRTIEEPAHRAALLRERKAAADFKGRDRLRLVAPDFATLLERWSLRNMNVSLQVARSTKLLDLYGDDIFALAVGEAIVRQIVDTGALSLCCERIRRERNLPVPVELKLPEHAVDRDVVPHNLETYDAK
jgi:transposase